MIVGENDDLRRGLLYGRDERRALDRLRQEDARQRARRGEEAKGRRDPSRRHGTRERPPGLGHSVPLEHKPLRGSRTERPDTTPLPARFLPQGAQKHATEHTDDTESAL